MIVFYCQYRIRGPLSLYADMGSVVMDICSWMTREVYKLVVGADLKYLGSTTASGASTSGGGGFATA